MHINLILIQLKKIQIKYSKKVKPSNKIIIEDLDYIHFYKNERKCA